MLAVEKIQNAAKMIEHDGVSAYQSVQRGCGRDVALTLIIAHLRRQFGGGESFPSDPSIDKKVVDILKEEGII